MCRHPAASRCDPSNFLGACERVLAYHEDKRLPLAIEYGGSQALLLATAHVARTTLADVICSEFSLPWLERPVPIFAQSGGSRESTSIRCFLSLWMCFHME
ncbi:hypothetical protein ACFIOY_18905 [Bradyrhizobium sp. TZ2]